MTQRKALKSPPSPPRVIGAPPLQAAACHSLTVAPLCRSQVPWDCAVRVWVELPGQLEDWLGIPVELQPCRGTADVPGSRSHLCRVQAEQDDRPDPSLVLMLDDDVIPTPRQVAALVELHQQVGGAVGLDYLARGFTSTRPGTVCPVPVTTCGGVPRYLMGGGCLLVDRGTLRAAVTASDGYPSASFVDPLLGWLADDYSLCKALGGVALLHGVMAHHLASGQPDGAHGDRLLQLYGLGEPRR